jgi:hypothetical protein
MDVQEVAEIVRIVAEHNLLYWLVEVLTVPLLIGAELAALDKNFSKQAISFAVLLEFDDEQYSV